MSYNAATGKFDLWLYTPSLPLAATAVGVFAILTAAHTWNLIRTHTWFCIPFVTGGLFEIIGYIGRCMAHSDTVDVTPYIMQSLLLLLAPILFAASVYMILSRLIRATKGESLSIIPVKWLTKIFVGGDIACFAIQGGGGGILSQAKSVADIHRGESIILGGLVLQIVVFGVFIVTAAIFHVRLRRSSYQMASVPRLPWERLMWTLYIVSLMISSRNVFRVLEYAMGSGGYLLRHEWTLYIFDGLLMAFVLLSCLPIYKHLLRRITLGPAIQSIGDVAGVELKSSVSRR